MSENSKAPVKKEISFKTTVIALLLIPLLIIGMCSVAIVITVGKIDGSETESETKTEEIQLPQLPEGISSITEYASELISTAAAAGDVMINNGFEVKISELQADISQEQLSFAEYLVPSYESAFCAMYEPQNCNYGEDASFAEVGNIEALSGECSFNDENTIIKTEIKLNSDSPIAKKLAETDEKIILDAAELKNAECRVNIVNTTAGEFDLYTESGVTEGKLTKLKLKRSYTVNAQIEFSGALAGLGVQNFTFTYTVTDTKDFKYAGIFISEDSISLDVNGYQTLTVTSNTAEDITAEDYKLTFTSSDPEKVKADANGMIEALAEGQNITVTATLEYLGNTYTDTCIVNVGETEEGGDNQ